MAYTDAPDAQERLGGFLGLCERHGIPCSSFQVCTTNRHVQPPRVTATSIPLPMCNRHV